MKKLSSIIAAVILTATMYAQVPQKMSYQAVIRNSSNQLIVNRQVGIRISILQGTASGVAQYIETQLPTTNANGLVSIEIGSGSVVSGIFALIDWASGPYFLKTETDVNGGSTYTISGTNQLLSVPYSLAAGLVAVSKNGKGYESFLKDDGTYAGLVSIDVQQPYAVTPTVKDIDNNVYGTVKIGTQIWMTENLKVTKYNDGTSIPVITSATAWATTTTGAITTYNNTTKADTIATYGRLYNWYAVNTNKLCPAGWHVPTNADWAVLSDYLGSFAGGRLKEIGSTHWAIPNTDAVNDAKFTALPAGARFVDGTFYGIGEYASWWSSTTFSSTTSLTRYLYYSNGSLNYTNNTKTMGLSVRCIKD